MPRLESLVSKAKRAYRRAKHSVLHLTEVEAYIYDLTDDSPTQLFPSDMDMVSSWTYQYEKERQIMGMIYRRLNEPAKSWRSIYKSLVLLDYLLIHGPESLIDIAVSHAHSLRALSSYSFYDENGRDQGTNVRSRVSHILAYLHDLDKLQISRQQAKSMNERPGMGRSGISSDDYARHPTTTSSSNTSYQHSFQEHRHPSYDDHYHQERSYRGDDDLEEEETDELEASTITATSSMSSQYPPHRTYPSTSSATFSSPPMQPQMDLLLLDTEDPFSSSSTPTTNPSTHALLVDSDSVAQQDFADFQSAFQSTSFITANSSTAVASSGSSPTSPPQTLHHLPPDLFSPVTVSSTASSPVAMATASSSSLRGPPVRETDPWLMNPSLVSLDPASFSRKSSANTRQPTINNNNTHPSPSF